MSSSQSNQLFWLKYAQAIKDQTGLNLSSNDALFVAGDAMMGPAVGNGIPEEYTNQGIYKAANSLLTSDNLFWGSSASQGFAQTLQSYLASVDLGGNRSPQLEIMLQQAREDLEAAQAQFSNSRQRALAHYAKAANMGLTNGMDFASWVQMNAPEYSASSSMVQQSSARLQQIQLQIGGPAAAGISGVQSALMDALSGQSSRPGCNMPSAVGDNMKTSELLKAQSAGQNVPRPPVVFVPAYSAPTYSAIGQQAQQGVIAGQEPRNSVELSINPGDDTSKYNFGQADSAASASGYGWLSFGSSNPYDEDFPDVDVGSDASSIKIRMTFNDVSQVPVQPGMWADGISNLKLSNHAPNNLKNLMRPSSIIAVSNLGYEIQFSGSVGSTLNSKINETTSAGGNMRVFGVKVSLGADYGSHDGGETTHKYSWDSSSNTLKITPNAELPVPIIVAMVGEKVQAS